MTINLLRLLRYCYSLMTPGEIHWIYLGQRLQSTTITCSTPPDCGKTGPHLNYEIFPLRAL